MFKGSQLYFTSLGIRLTEDILKLAATLIVLIRLLHHFSLTPPSLSEYKNALKMPSAGQDVWAHMKDSPLANRLGLFRHSPDIEEAIKYYKHIGNEHPMVYSILELGHSWEEVVLKMLDIPAFS